jgi:hypothetical protein
MSNLKSIAISISLIIVNAVIGYNLPPGSILFTPLVIGIISFILGRTGLKTYYIILLILIALFSNDVLIKLTAGGGHDFEGAGVINLFFIVGVVISTIITFTILIKQQRKVIPVLFFCISIPAISFLYLCYFDFLGLVGYQNTSKSKEIAIKNKVFLNNIKFADNLINYKADTVKIIDGWAEKQVIVDHQQLIKKYDDTSTINYTFKLKSNTSFDSLKMYYKVNDTDVNGSNAIDSIIAFNCLKSAPKVTVYFFKLGNTFKNNRMIGTKVIK